MFWWKQCKHICPHLFRSDLVFLNLSHCRHLPFCQCKMQTYLAYLLSWVNCSIANDILKIEIASQCYIKCICVSSVQWWRQNGNLFLKGDKDKKRKRSWRRTFCHVLFQWPSLNHPRPSCDCPPIFFLCLSPPQCLVRLTVITQKQIFSSENKVMVSPPVECGMPLHGKIISPTYFACHYLFLTL